jgi:hypothetical protein
LKGVSSKGLANGESVEVLLAAVIGIGGIGADCIIRVMDLSSNILITTGLLYSLLVAIILFMNFNFSEIVQKYFNKSSLFIKNSKFCLDN